MDVLRNSTSMLDFVIGIFLTGYIDDILMRGLEEKAANRGRRSKNIIYIKKIQF